MIDVGGMRRSMRGMEALAIAVSISITDAASLAAWSGVSPARTNIFVTCSTYCGTDLGEMRRFAEVVIAVGQGKAALINFGNLFG